MNQKYESIPNIRLTGKWLEEAGFQEGDTIQVEIVQKGKLVLNIDTINRKVRHE